MEDVKNFRVVDCEKSNFIKPLKIFYTQNGKDKAWDALKVHDSVVIIIYNSSRDVLVFVKQFRPAVYISRVDTIKQDDGSVTIDHTKFPPSLGITYELCAGIVDKSKPIVEIAQDEVFEECGYKVPLDRFRRVTGYRSGVGTNGSYQNMFYIEVTDDMKVSSGGGNPLEGELIDIVEIPVSEGRKFVMDEAVVKPLGVMFGIQWFYDNIKPELKST
ncbi:Nudix hydrolase 14 [Mactra antiquata]